MSLANDISVGNPLLSNVTDVDAFIFSIGSAIPHLAFTISVSLVFAVAILCAVARTVMRVMTKKPLYWDDLFLAIGTAALIATTGLLLQNTFFYYLAGSLNINPSLVLELPPNTLDHLLIVSLPQIGAQGVCAWTTIFCVKASFLIISKQLIVRLPWLKVFFWITVGITTVSYVIMVASTWIQCPYTGYEAVVKCTGPGREDYYLAMSVTVALLDIITDILVSAIPIIVLWRSTLTLHQKFVVGPFLCLSLVMVAFAAVRVSKTTVGPVTDIVWLSFWQYLEAAIAIIVTSITTLRTVFTAKRHQREQVSLNQKSYFSVHVGGGSGKNTDATFDILMSDEAQLMEDMKKEMPGLPQEPTRIYVQDAWTITYDVADKESP